MHSFKPLLQGGNVEKQELAKARERSNILHDAQVKVLNLPEFDTSLSQEPDNQAALEPGDNSEPAVPEPAMPVAYDLPDMTASAEETEQLHVRKHADIKNKTFMPLLTVDPDEDPVEAARLEAANIMAQANDEAQAMRAQAQAILQDAHDSVAGIIEQANQLNQQALAAVEQAQAQVPTILEAAREEGFNQGYQDGMEQGMVAGQARLEALMADFTQAAKNVVKARDDVAKALTPEIVAFVEACLDRIFFSANSVDAGLVAKVVNHAISRLDELSHVTVRLNPGNLEHIPKLAPAMWAKMQAMGNITWIPDPDLRPGDCVVDTPVTQIDATIDTRRQRIFAQLEDTLKQGYNLDLGAILQSAAEKRANAELKEMGRTPAIENGTPVQAPQDISAQASGRPSPEAETDPWGDDDIAEGEAQSDLNPDDDW